MKRLFVGIGVVLSIITGCATQANFEAKLSSFIGHSEDDLVRSWGPPQSSYPLRNNSKSIQYVRSGQAFIPGSQTATTTVYGNQAFTTVNGMPPMLIAQQCTVNWIIDKDGVIITYQYFGNACKSR